VVNLLRWIKDGKGSSTILFCISIFSLCIAFLLVFINSENDDWSRIVNLLKTDGAKAYAIFGLIALIFLGAIIAQLFFGSLLLYFVSKLVFRIPLEFEAFYKIIKIFFVFIALGVCWQLINFIRNSIVASIILNPFIILGLITIYLLFRFLSDVNRFKPLLFIIFLYSSYLILSISYLEG
jgi:hypothetical protein